MACSTWMLSGKVKTVHEINLLSCIKDPSISLNFLSLITEEHSVFSYIKQDI